MTELGPNVLRVIDSVGGQTGIQVQKASENARATTRTSSSGDGDSSDVVAVIGLTILAILAKAKAMVNECCGVVRRLSCWTMFVLTEIPMY